MKEGPDVRGGLLEEVELQLDFEGFKKEEVISGEEVELLWTLKAQRKRFFSFAIFSFQRRQKNSLHKQNPFSLPRRCHLLLRQHVVLSLSLTGPIVVRTQRKHLGGKVNLSLIKLEMFPWVYKKEKERGTNFTVGSKG